MIPGNRNAAAVATLVVLAALPACELGGSAAFQAYKDFVRASTRGDCDTLYGLAERDAVAFVDYLCKRRSMSIMGKTVDLVILEKSFQGHGGERKPTWLRRHTATVELRDGKWKLTRFREEILQKYD